MRYFMHPAPFLVAAAILLYPLIASADSKTVGTTTITGNQEDDGYTTRDNVVGKLTDKPKGGRAKGIADVKITIKNPKGDVVGTGTTDSNGDYNIDTNMDDVSGWTLTFECDYINVEMTM